MRKKKIANLIMVAVITVIAAIGLLAAGKSQDWFAGGEEAAMAAESNEVLVEEASTVMERALDEECKGTEEIKSVSKADTVTKIGKTEESIEAEEITKAEETTKAEKNPKVKENTKAQITTKAKETTKTEETTKVQKTTKTPETNKAEEVTKVQETTKTPETNKAEEVTKVQETTKTPETSKAEEGTKAQETTKESETTKAPETTPTETIPEDKLTCTIRIKCDTILDNWDKLDPDKVDCVPENGTILGKKTVEFEEGETVYDVLRRVCDDYGIHMETSWTPMYDSYYIEGINYIYEFDCGSESGWMYKVNGWFPNYGCSSYELEDGDSITWCYTCVGLGADVGGSNY